MEKRHRININIYIWNTCYISRYDIMMYPQPVDSKKYEQLSIIYSCLNSDIYLSK